MVSMAKVMKSSQLANVIESVGKDRNSHIKEDIKSIEGLYKNPSYLETLNVSTYARERNELILAFIYGFGNITKTDLSQQPKKSMQVSCLVESLYKLSSPLFNIGPVSFMTN